MRKSVTKKIFTCIYLLIPFTLLSQERVSINVVYEFNYVRDLENAANPYKANMVLSIGKNTSRFVEESVFNENNKSVIAAQKKQQEKAATVASSKMITVTGSPMLFITNAGAIVREEIMLEKKKDNLINVGHLGLKTYYYNTEIPQIKWRLEADKKDILGYECQKAIGDFAGRTYEVWFAAALPYSFGPWKLQELPGLILQAKDSKNEVAFTAKEITKNTDPEELIIPFLKTDDAIKVKEKEYNQTLEMLVKDPQSIVSAQFPNTTLYIKNKENPSNKEVVKVRKYNPMELK